MYYFVVWHSVCVFFVSLFFQRWNNVAFLAVVLFVLLLLFWLVRVFLPVSGAVVVYVVLVCCISWCHDRWLGYFYVLCVFLCWFVVLLFILAKPIVDMCVNESRSLPNGDLFYLLFVSPHAIIYHRTHPHQFRVFIHLRACVYDCCVWACVYLTIFAYS